MIKLTHDDIYNQVTRIAGGIKDNDISGQLHIFGIPRGGIPVAYHLLKHFPSAVIVDDPEKANVIVDDIVASGKTMKRYRDINPAASFFALYKADDFRDSEDKKEWLVFPWEESEVGSAEDIPIRLLQFIGENPKREGLLETPRRMIEAWRFWTKGYKEKPQDVLKVFKDGGENYDQMVFVGGIPIYSHCEHHLAPFFGVAHVAYIPDKHIVGLSKLPRLVQIFARRLQVQERMTSEIAETIQKELKPQGVAVMVNCRHMCMESRGIQQQGSNTVTSAIKGCFAEDPSAKAEFFELIKTARQF